MTLGTKIAGFAAFGVAVRAWALGIQKRPVFERPITHAATAAAFGTLGYCIYHWEIQQNELIEKRHKELGRPKWEGGKGFRPTVSWTGQKLDGEGLPSPEK